MLVRSAIIWDACPHNDFWAVVQVMGIQMNADEAPILAQTRCPQLIHRSARNKRILWCPLSTTSHDGIRIGCQYVRSHSIMLGSKLRLSSAVALFSSEWLIRHFIVNNRAMSVRPIVAGYYGSKKSIHIHQVSNWPCALSRAAATTAATYPSGSPGWSILHVEFYRCVVAVSIRDVLIHRRPVIGVSAIICSRTTTTNWSTWLHLRPFGRRLLA